MPELSKKAIARLHQRREALIDWALTHCVQRYNPSGLRYYKRRMRRIDNAIQMLTKGSFRGVTTA